jgi:cell division protein FtsB
MTQTTERIYELIGAPRLWETEHDVAERRAVAQTIAAEIDALTRERDEARAEVAKLKEQNRILATTSLRDVIKSVHPSGRARGQ